MVQIVQIDSQVVARLFEAGLDQPVERQWCAYSISLLLDRGMQWPGIHARLETRQPHPAEPPGLAGLRVAAPMLVACIDWVLTTRASRGAVTEPDTRAPTRPPMATLALLAVATHATCYPSLYWVDPADETGHCYQASLAIRRMCKWPEDWARDTGHCTDIIEAAVHALDACLQTHAAQIAPIEQRWIRRLVTWLQLRPTVDVVAGVPDPPRALPAPLDVSPADEALDMRLDAARPVDVAGPRDADGETDPAQRSVIVPLSMPGAGDVVRSGPRTAMTALMLRAAARREMAGRVADMAAISDAALSELTHALQDAHMDARVIVLVVGALYGGMPLAAFARLPVVESLDAVPSTRAAILRAPLALVLPATVAAHLPAADPQWAGNCLVPGPQVVLPLPTGAAYAPVIATWISGREAGARVASPVDVRAAMAWLASHAAAHASPVTSRRLPQVLREACAATGIGLAESSLLRGRRSSDSLASNHYYAATPQALVTTYVPVIEWMSERLGGVPMLNRPTPLGTIIGCRRHPTAAAVDAYMDRLRAIDVSRTAGRPTTEQMRERHLRIQALVYEIALWATGARPFLRALDALLDAEGIITIDDKAKPGGAGLAFARTLPVCRLLRSTIEFWRRHRREVARQCRLGLITHAWFVIDGDRTVRAATLKDLRAPLPVSGLPRNAARIWWRSQLSALQLAGPAMDGGMGHWVLGSEPGRSTSAQVPARVDRNMRAAIDRMVDALGLPDLAVHA